MPRTLTRGGFLAAAGSLALAPRALAAAPETDVASLRLVIGVELVLVHFYERLTAAHPFRADVQRELGRALAAERAHVTGLSNELSARGEVPPAAGDFDFSLPALDRPAVAARLGRTLETAAVGAYLGGVQTVSDPGLRSLFARIAASEAEHLSVFTGLYGRRVGLAFPVALDEQGVSAVIDRYLS